MKILHLEDEEFTAKLVQRLCIKADITLVSSLFAAKEMLKTECFDLLLVDLNLGDSFGMNTVEELVDYNIPIIVLSADPNDEFVKDAARLGVADYISKLNLSKVDLPLRLQFVHSRNQKVKEKKRGLKFEDITRFKPYLNCAVLA